MRTQIKMLLLRSGVDHPVMQPFADVEIALHLGHISNQLGDKACILGDGLSGADFGICYMVSMADRLGLLGEYPELKGYMERMMARDGFRRAVDKAVE